MPRLEGYVSRKTSLSIKKAPLKQLNLAYPLITPIINKSPVSRVLT